MAIRPVAAAKCCVVGRCDAVGAPAARMCHRRWQTMLNRWQAHKGAACGEVAPIIMCLEVAQHCSTSSTPNDSEISAPRRLRYRSTSGYAWFAISDGTSSLREPLQHRIALQHNTSQQPPGVLPYAPTASHQCAPTRLHRAPFLRVLCRMREDTLLTRQRFWREPKGLGIQKRGCNVVASPFYIYNQS